MNDEDKQKSFLIVSNNIVPYNYILHNLSKNSRPKI